MKNSRNIILATCVAVILATGSLAFAQGGGATVVLEDAIWAHGELYGTVATPTSFRNVRLRSTDVIYSFMMNEIGGQRSVSETAPGDRDYNGGRWNVHLAFYTPQGETYFDQDGDDIVDFELTSAEEVLAEVTAGNLEIIKANFYFVCPLLP
jgi:hypothetical protein